MKQSTILIIEDDPSLMQAYARALRSEVGELLQAAGGREGLRLCRERRPDVVLLDLMLPDADGIDLCRQIKSDPATAHAFVVMISGHHTSGAKQVEAIEGGADGYLVKPIGPQALRAHVQAFVRIKRGEDELRASEGRLRRQAEELREANRRLEEYNRLKAEFVANMSHELRTPLTAIIGFAQLVRINQHDGPLPDRYADALERILRNGRHLLSLIDDVLDISKIEAGRVRLHREHVDLIEVVQNAFGELQSLAQRKNLTYRLSVPDRLPFAYTDALRVRQILINLLSNAIKFTARGAIEVELRRAPEEHFQLVVRDTGVGIDEKSLEVIFERFRQIDGSMSRTAGGAGLGLSIVRQIAALLGGRIEVESRVNAGSTFTVTLPMSAPADESAAEQQRGQPPRSFAAGAVKRGDDESVVLQAAERGEGARPLVLIIEDDPDSAALFSETVSGAGYRVRVAENGVDGLRLIRELQPAAVMLDVMMPGMDGWRVLREMKADDKVTQIPVIVCSIVDNRPLGYSLGATDYLLKPVEPEQLIRVLRDASLDAVAGGEEGAYVLIVDDEHGVRELLTNALRQGGFAARSAASGETALRMMTTSRPGAVLCDLMMPGGMSGFELIARMRALPETADVPVVVVTGKDMTAEDRRLIAGQIADVIRKGELMMSDVSSRLLTTLNNLGLKS